jgi:hypothetical protein
VNPNFLVEMRRKPLAGAALGIAGLVLAMLAVYVGTGLHDGFGDWDLHRLGRRLRRALVWALPLAGVGGWLLHGYYQRLLQGRMSGWVLTGSVLRAFVHFPLFGALALFAMMWSFVLAGGRLLARLWRRREAAPEDPEPALQRWIGPPVWFIMLPFIMLKVQVEGDLELPETVSRRRLLRWLPALIAMIFLYTDAVSEDTGERIDPYWLTLAASVWLIDYLIVAFQVAPELRARRRAQQATENP